MRINGEWLDCGGGISCPIIAGHIETADGAWVAADFLVDTGADRTVICADIATVLGFQKTSTSKSVAGVGGAAAVEEFETRIRMTRDDGQHVVLKSQFAAFTDSVEVDMCVLGRDILGLFSVIVDHTGDTIALIRDRHKYRIEFAK